jgi:hypothetical protein
MEILIALIPLIAKLLMAIGGFAAVATVTPNSSNNKILHSVLTGINVVGMNLGKAGNDPSK